MPGTKTGPPPLNLAARRRRSVSVVRALIESGADVDSRDRFGRTPLHNVIGDPPRDEAQRLEVVPIHARTDRQITRQQSDIGLLPLDNGAAPNAPDDNAMTALDAIDEDSPLRGTIARRLTTLPAPRAQVAEPVSITAHAGVVMSDAIITLAE